MKEKFIRILSPVSLTVIALLDAAVLGYGIFAVKKITEAASTKTIFFLAAELAAVVIAVLVTREELSHGIKFYDDELEFTAIDQNNIFSYADIVSVETQKDTNPSLVKNFLDRSSRIILTLKEDKIATIDIGITTKNSVEKLAEEIRNAAGISGKE